MIIEAFKIVSSVFPFIKEAFLWRDGADADKPVTAADLRRRKIAVFTLFASLVLNYLTISKLWEGHGVEVDLKAKIEAYKQDQKTMVQASTCVDSQKIYAMATEIANKQIESYIQLGLLQRAPTPTQAPPAEAPTKPPKGHHR